jgi:hypothetical protein
MIEPNAVSQEKPRLILTHGEKGGVGKTTVARVIADYLLSKSVPYRGYDAEGRTGQLLRFYQNVTQPIDVTDAASVAPVLDNLMDASASNVALVDLGARSGAEVKSWLYRGGALEEAVEGRLGLTVVYVIGNAVDSVGHLKECYTALGPQMNYVLARNLGVASRFDIYDGSHIRSEILGSSGREITIPALDPVVFQSVDKASVSFEDFASNRGGSFSYTERRYCRTWLRECYAALDGVEDLLK